MLKGSLASRAVLKTYTHIMVCAGTFASVALRVNGENLHAQSFEARRTWNHLVS